MYSGEESILLFLSFQHSGWCYSSVQLKVHIYKVVCLNEKYLAKVFDFNLLLLEALK